MYVGMESVPRVISLSPKNTMLFNPLEVCMLVVLVFCIEEKSGGF